MKQKDIALILVIVFVSAVISLLVSNMLFASPKKRQEQVEVVQPITAEFPAADTHYFNDKAINPTRTITIGNNNNTDPFSGSQ